MGAGNLGSESLFNLLFPAFFASSVRSSLSCQGSAEKNHLGSLVVKYPGGTQQILFACAIMAEKRENQTHQIISNNFCCGCLSHPTIRLPAFFDSRACILSLMSSQCIERNGAGNLGPEFYFFCFLFPIFFNTSFSVLFSLS